MCLADCDYLFTFESVHVLMRHIQQWYGFGSRHHLVNVVLPDVQCINNSRYKEKLSATVLVSSLAYKLASLLIHKETEQWSHLQKMRVTLSALKI